MKWIVRGKEIDFRVATAPTLHGESMVLRILDRDAVPLDFEALGLCEPQLPVFLAQLARPNGIVLVTGPTGSGKTTTLYAALSRLNSSDRKILTAEDPVEYQLTGINQVQVKPDIGLTFAQVLRAALRHDPDILMVGEIRDLETAQIAIQAALTGHLVLSTVHTNSAAATIVRLLDLGVPDYLLTATVCCVVAQRLVRILCRTCREPYQIGHRQAEETGLAPGSTLYRARGCEACHGSGYAGRIGLYEVMALDEGLRKAVTDRADGRQLHALAVEGGMRSLYQDGLAKCVAGLTTLEEVWRVTADR
jgi:general secretion pathway protein E